MKINQKQNDFLEKRRRLLKAWRYVGPMMLFAIFCLVLFLKISTPLLINPYEVISRLESGTIDQSSLEMMAVLLPVIFILVCFILVVLVVMMYMAYSNEKKYLEILEAIKRER
jgi:hypothetical protein